MLSWKKVVVVCVTLISILFVSSGFCTTISDIIGDASSTETETVDSDESDPSAGKDFISNETHSAEKSYFAIQAGVHLKQNDADQQIIELQSSGLDPYIFQSVNSKSQTVYSVRIGKFESYSAADSELDSIANSVNTPLLITSFDSLNPVSASAKTSSSAKSVSIATSKHRLNNPGDTDTEDIDTNQYDEIYDSPSLKALLEKIDSLEQSVDQLRDEAEVRRQLTITDEEAASEEEDILEAAGREYTLTEAGNIKFRLGVSYAYSDYDAIKQSTRVEVVSNHTLSTNFNVSYGLKDNLTVGVGIPFKYKYHKVGTIDSIEENDLGDLNLSWQLQPLKASTDLPTFIVNGGFSVPVGKSPYEIQPGSELSTSSGLLSTNLGVSISQVSDPVVVFGSLGATYSFTQTDINQKRTEGVLDEVDPGVSLGLGMGMGYALSYKLNINLSFSYSYSFETKYKYQNAPTATSGVGVGADLSLGVGYRVSQNQNINFTIGIPITDSRSFSFSCSTPIEFEL